MLTFIMSLAFAVAHYPMLWMRRLHRSIMWRTRACWAFTATFIRLLATTR